MKKVLFLIYFFSTLAFSQVDTLTVRSEIMDKNLKAAITLPEGYAESNTKYPVVYLLHGGFGAFSDWHQKVTEPGLVPKLADQYQLIIVTPGVGPSSYYYDSPIMDSVQYESYIIRELIPFIDQNYRTLDQKESRAITGLSMGGHGAMMLAAKHRNLFTAVGTMSGVMNIDTRLWKVPEDFRNIRVGQQKAMLGANLNYDAPNFNPYTVMGLLDQLEQNGQDILIDCGVDDFLIETNRQLHQALLDREVPHEYTERPGAHTWQYWTEALPVHILFLNRHLSRE